MGMGMVIAVSVKSRCYYRLASEKLPGSSINKIRT